MSIASEYRDGVIKLVTEIAGTQEENIKRGARLCADAPIHKQASAHR